MDPITTAILGVLPTLAGDTLKAGVKDAYEGLKEVIRRKWGESAPITKAISAIEEDPHSKVQASVLEESVRTTKAFEDSEVVRALGILIDQMRSHGIGGDQIANIQINISGGTQTGIIGAKSVSASTINFGKN
jgi:hypothetical protein